MLQRERPLGTTILAVLYFVGVATYSVLFLLAVFSPEGLGSVLQSLSPGGSGPATLLALGWALPLYFGVLALVVAALGHGMWKLKNWARIITILIAAISFVGTLLSLGATQGTVLALVLTALRVGLPIVVIWYLVRSGVRAVFRPKNGVSAQ